MVGLGDACDVSVRKLFPRAVRHETQFAGVDEQQPGTGSEEAGLRFLPVEIVAEVKASPAMPLYDNRIEIELAGGHRMRISGGYDPEALARLIRGLTA